MQDQPFYAPKPEHEVDLVIMVGEALIAAGLKDRVEAWYITNPLIISGKGKTLEVQRFVLDRYWRNQLLRLEASSEFKIHTLDIRQHLLIGGPSDVWYNHFVKYVIPFIADHNLPGPELQ